jgi:AcrR family transcriptional regulator
MPAKESASQPSRERLLMAAQRLFADHGVNGVGLRDIAKAAGHKNANSIRYHFGSKESLIKAIIVWGGQQGELWRQQSLDALESREEPPSTREIIEIMLGSALGHESSSEYVRFIAQVTLSHRDLIWSTYRQAVGDSMARCYEHLRNSIEGVPENVLEQRFAFLEIYVQHVVSVWDTQKRSRRRKGRWQSSIFYGNLFDTVEGMLTAPCCMAGDRHAPGGSTSKHNGAARSGHH